MSCAFVLPELTTGWPFKSILNPHYEAASAASTEWVESFHAFDSKAQATFNRCRFGLLASLAYPHVESEYLRVGCDLMNWFFIYDELSDVKDGASVRDLSATLISALSDPFASLPSSDSVLSEVTKDFWSRTLGLATQSSARRLFGSLRQYIEAVCQEAGDREQELVRNIQDYLAIRRESAGPRPCFDFFLLSFDVPEEAMSHPHIQRLTDCAMDLIVLANDIYSYNFERAHGLDGHNMVTVVMKEKSLDVQGAIDYAAELFHQTAQNYLDGLKDVPSFSPSVDRVIGEYLFGIGNWVAALHEWSFESERYFGTDGPYIKRNRVVKLSRKPSKQQQTHADGRGDWSNGVHQAARQMVTV